MASGSVPAKEYGVQANAAGHSFACDGWALKLSPNVTVKRLWVDSQHSPTWHISPLLVAVSMLPRCTIYNCPLLPSLPSSQSVHRLHQHIQLSQFDGRFPAFPALHVLRGTVPELQDPNPKLASSLPPSSVSQSPRPAQDARLRNGVVHMRRPECQLTID